MQFRQKRDANGIKWAYFSSLIVCLGGCNADKFLPANTVLWSNTNITASIPGMDGDDTVAAANCVSQGSVNGSILTVDCSAVLSNGVSDLLNDANTAASLVPGAEGFIKGVANNACTAALQGAIVTGLNKIPDGPFRTVAQDYVNKQSLVQRAPGYCQTAIDTVWNETNNDIYSDGSKCAAVKAHISLVSVNLPPNVAFQSGPIIDPFCPHARLQVAHLPFSWGND